MINILFINIEFFFVIQIVIQCVWLVGRYFYFVFYDFCSGNRVVNVYSYSQGFEFVCDLSYFGMF